jgi:hypothetical protein
MPKTRSKRKAAPMRRGLKLPSLWPVEAHATAQRFDGGAVKVEIVFQPKAAARISDQLVNALLPNGRRRAAR